MSPLVLLVAAGALMVVGAVAAIALDPPGRWADVVVGPVLAVGVVLMLGTAYYLTITG